MTELQTNATTTTHPEPAAVPVQVRLDHEDFQKLEQLARGLGCHRTQVLRILLRQCQGIEVGVTR